MKKQIWLILFVAVFAASCVIYVPYEDSPRPERRPYDDRGYARGLDTSYFYEYLSPYGVWVHHQPYGYVWLPRNPGYRWHPYTYGRWLWTDYGWTWVSYFEWGWIPFHYGRWGWDRYLGWYWVPGTVWAPAWVTWRWGGTYIGWAPLPPDVPFIPGRGIFSVSVNLPYSYWIFIDGRYFMDPYLNRYVLPHERNMTIIRRTSMTTNIHVRDTRVINEGLDINQLRRITKQDISKHQLQDSARPGKSRVSASSLEVYRPSVSKNELAKPKTVLSREEARERISLEEIRQPGERKVIQQDPEAGIKEEQERERQLLQKSQREEMIEIESEFDEEKRGAKSDVEKKEVEKKYEVKVKELKKHHQEEKTKLEGRHQEEEESAKKKKKIKKDN